MLKKLLIGFATALGMATQTAYAGLDLCQIIPGLCGDGGGNAVPELSGSMGYIAVSLLVGIIGIAVERKRRNSR